MIRQHHSQAGRDPFFKSSLLGGDPLEGYPAGGMWVEDVAYDDDVVADVPEDINFNTADVSAEEGNDATRNEDIDPPLDEYHEVQRHVMEAFRRGDALHEEVNNLQGDVDDDDDAADDTVDGMEELYMQATTPVYPASKTSIVSATIIIMNMCFVFRVSNKFTNELFRFLSADLLPEGNKMPTNHYKARKSIKRLGLTYNSIHACPHGCILYEDEHEALQSCLKCNTSRWMDGSASIPKKVIRHFPLIPCLRRMWRSPKIANMLAGYTKHVSSDGVMRSMVDSQGCLLCRDGSCSVTTSRQNRHDDGTTSCRTLSLP